MNFFHEVYRLTKKIPKGKVATYGQIASLISSPRAARVVGFAMRALPPDTDVPWQRVINAKGMISIVNGNFPKSLQANLLKKDGIRVDLKDGNYFVDLTKYLYRF